MEKPGGSKKDTQDQLWMAIDAPAVVMCDLAEKLYIETYTMSKRRICAILPPPSPTSPQHCSQSYSYT